MKNKFLVLGFKNARQFRPGKYKDKVGDINGTRDRDDIDFFEEPITKYQVSNLLHVLFGERPSPTLRETLIPRIDYYFDKANNSYIKLDSLKINNNFVYETMQIKKSAWNSWNPNVWIYWEKVKQMLDENYDDFISLMKKEYGFNPLEKSFNEWIPIIRENGVIKNYLLNVKGKKPIYDYVYSDNKQERANINKNSRTMRTVLTAPVNITKHHGEIIIPVSDEDLSKLSRANGTILDGGFVWIKGVFSENQIDWDGFQSVNEINSEKTNLTKYYENKNKFKQEQN